MKPVFETLLRKGIESAKLEAVFDGVDQRGHVILRDVRTKFGVEHHAWLNYRCTAMLPPVKRGDRIQFWADLQPYKKIDGSRSIRLECAREARVVSG